MDNPNIKLAASSNREVGPDYNGGGRARDGLSGRVASLEAKLERLATKDWILTGLIIVIFSVVSTVGAGVWYLSGRLTTIETRIIGFEASFDSYKEFHNREHDRKYSPRTKD